MKKYYYVILCKIPAKEVSSVRRGGWKRGILWVYTPEN